MRQFAKIAVLTAVVSGCALSARGVAGSPPKGSNQGPRAQRVSVFSGFQVWGIDDGRTVRKLGLSLKTLYILHDEPLRLSTIPFGDAWGVSRADISPAGDVLAYAVFGVGKRDSGQVVVADTSGGVLAVFPRARRFRWNTDGSLLALGYSHEDVTAGYDNLGERTAKGDSVKVWRRADRRSRSYRVRPMTIEWGVRDTLYLGYPGKVDALDARFGRVSPTGHRWAAVSPDGEYSLLRDEVRSSGFQCIEETTGMQVSGCLLKAIGFSVGSIGTYMSEPVWIRSPVPGHLLCVSACDDYWGLPGQTNCRSAILDPRTLEPLHSFPGRVVAQGHDGRSLVVLNGDTLCFVDVAPRAQWRGRSAAVRVKLEVQSWGGGPDHIGPETQQKWTWYYEVKEGDWLPMQATSHDGSCDKVFQVRQVIGPDSIRVSIPARVFTNGITSATITRAPVTLRTDSRDAGYDVSLSVVP